METKTNKDKDKIIQVQQFQYGNIANRELRIVPIKEWNEYKKIMFIKKSTIHKRR